MQKSEISPITLSKNQARLSANILLAVSCSRKSIKPKVIERILLTLRACVYN